MGALIIGMSALVYYSDAPTGAVGPISNQSLNRTIYMYASYGNETITLANNTVLWYKLPTTANEQPYRVLPYDGYSTSQP